MNQQELRELYDKGCNINQLAEKERVNPRTIAVRLTVSKIPCDVCGEITQNSTHNGRVYCSRHLTQLRKHGRITYPSRIKNEVYKENDYYVMKATDYDGVYHDVYFSEESYGEIIKHKWRVRNDGYVECKFNKKVSLMHRLIMEEELREGDTVDHINRNKLDNRKSNLRVVSVSQNQVNKARMTNNTSGVTGVTWDKSRNKWKSYLNIDNKTYNLGRFDTLQEATQARRLAEIKYHQDYSPLERKDCTEKITRIKELIIQLNDARDAYYNNSQSIMSDREYDTLFDELNQLEMETGLIMSDSPTHTVGYEVKSKLSKVQHNHPMLSLDKTKDIHELYDFVDNKLCLMMLKLDGLTISLRYLDGKLVAAETRGNGLIGEDCLHTVKTFVNVPLEIDYKDEIVVDGEAIIDYKIFQSINETNKDDTFKTPRNLVSGTVRQLNSEIAASRHVKFIAWKSIKGFERVRSFMGRLISLRNLGFDIVPYKQIFPDMKLLEIQTIVDQLKSTATKNNYPIDGLVLSYDDVALGEALGATEHHVKYQLAFKFYDEETETIVHNVEWNVGRTGVLTPVAEFDTVSIDNTEISKASLHNVSIFEKLELSYGDTISVIRANGVIPQITDNISRSKDNIIPIPTVCPECGRKAVVKQKNESKVLFCTNPACKAKLLSRFTHFVSRDCMNIDGLSEATLEKMIDNGWIKGFSDLYLLRDRTDYIKGMMALPGLGKRSVNNILAAIDKSRNVQLNNFINALGIPGIGKKQAKEISEYFEFDFNKYEQAILGKFNFRKLDGFGDILYDNIYEWYDNVDKEDYSCLVAQMDFAKPEDINRAKSLNGKTFVITGSLAHFSNRDELVKTIENAGGKTAGSVSKNTSYLINNDINSSSSKNKKAKNLRVSIITEEDFIKMI